MPEPEILNVPPCEAVEFFRSKGYHVGFGWRDTAAGAWEVLPELDDRELIQRLERNGFTAHLSGDAGLG